MPVSRVVFYICLGVPNKEIILIKQNVTFLSKDPVEDPLHGHPFRLLWR
jgi:hypothetical protein